MNFRAITIGNKEITFNGPNFFTIEIDSKAPADSMVVTFSCDERVDEIKEISAYSDNTLMFDGIIDEQQFMMMNTGLFLKLYVRSKAGLLLDNEALPQIYSMVSINNIFDRHMKPYGFLGIRGGKEVVLEKFSITKGMSEWDVINNFCEQAFGITPRITMDGYIDLTDPKDYPILRIDEKNGEICNYMAKENIRRCDLISQIFLRVQKDGAYDQIIINSETEGKGVLRKRYVNLVDSNKMTLPTVENKIEESNQDAYKMVVTTNGPVITRIGTRVEINDKIFGNIKNLRVEKIKYTLNPESDTTELTLMRD